MTNSYSNGGSSIGGTIPAPKSCSGEMPVLPKIVERLYYNTSEIELLSSNINSSLEKLGIIPDLIVPASSEVKEFGIVGELERLNNRLIVLREVIFQLEEKLRKLI